MDPREWMDKIAKAVSDVVSFTYDRVAVKKEDVLKATKCYGIDADGWKAYQQKAPFKVMDEVADGYILWTKIKVSGLSVPLGAAGLPAAIPDAVQFLGFTIRMVTGIAAAYGFDPDPDYLQGKVKTIILQAYLNGNVGKGTVEGVEKLTAAAAVKFLKNVPMRSNFLMKLIVAIGKVFGIRVTRQLLLKAVPGVSGAINGGLSWYLVRQIAKQAKEEFRTFRKDLRDGKYRGDEDYVGLGN
jgi:uncharacterized protein (DUF697 family)